MKNAIAVLLCLAATIVIPAQESISNEAKEKLSMNLTRTFNAPVEKMWQALSDSAMIKQWWGPEGFTASLVKMNFREGETSLVCMLSADGFEMCNGWTYTRIEPMRSIEFVQYFADQKGNRLSAENLGLPTDIPDAVPHVIMLEDWGNGSTRLTVTESGYTSQQTIEVSRTGMQQCLDKMEKLVVGGK